MITWTVPMYVAFLSAGPADTAAPPPALPASATATIADDAAAERKQRLVTGGLKVTAGALQTALGLYVLLGVPGNAPGIDQSGILNVAAGGGLILDGTLALSRRGPLEVVVRKPEFARADDSAEGERWLDRALYKAARRGRIERLVAGSLSLAGGLTILGLGIANLAMSDAESEPARIVIGASEVAVGLGFGGAAVRLLVLPSQAEHTLEVWNKQHRLPKPSLRVSVVPTLRGLQIRGQF